MEAMKKKMEGMQKKMEEMQMEGEQRQQAGGSSSTRRNALSLSTCNKQREVR
eukprot:SAG22_NODE_5755_length_958_cov_2.250291_1_plen_52_part_00